MTAEDRYEQALEGFKKAYGKGGFRTLRPHCEKYHIDYRGMLGWMKRSNLNASILKKELDSLVPPKNTSQVNSTNGFILVEPEQGHKSQTKEKPNLTKGIKLSFGDDVTLHLDHISPQEIASIISSYKKQMR